MYLSVYLSRKVYTESDFSLIRFFKVGRKVFLLAHAFPEGDRSNILSKDFFQKVDTPSYVLNASVFAVHLPRKIVHPSHRLAYRYNRLVVCREEGG